MALNLSCRLSNRYGLSGGPSRVKMLVEVAVDTPSQHATLPLNLTLLVDRSSSMLGEAMDSVKGAARHVVAELGGDDSIALVGFDAEVEVLVPSQKVVDRDGIGAAIDRLTAAGATNVHEAIAVGHREAMRHFAAEGLNRILLLSDGEATAGVTKDEAIHALADRVGADGVAISTLGVGEEYDEALLGEIARRSGGNHYFIESSGAVGDVYARELARMRSVVAKGLTLTVQPAPGAALTSLNERYPVRTYQGAVSVRFDEQESDRPQSVILDLTVPPRPSGEHEVASVTLTYDDLVARARGVALRRDLTLAHVDDPAQIRAGIDRDVLRRWEELSAMQSLRSIVERVRDGRIDPKTAVLTIDRHTQDLVKRKALGIARTFASVGRTIAEHGGVPTSLAKKTIVAVAEAQQGVPSRTILEPTPGSI